MNGEAMTFEWGSLLAGIICPGECVRKGREWHKGERRKFAWRRTGLKLPLLMRTWQLSTVPRILSAWGSLNWRMTPPCCVPLVLGFDDLQLCGTDFTGWLQSYCRYSPTKWLQIPHLRSATMLVLIWFYISVPNVGVVMGCGATCIHHVSSTQPSR
jgi:hypothetical protein